jgi:hypothetical protein
MSSLTEVKHPAEFVVSLGNGGISKETITVKSGENLGAGAVLGKITVGGKYVHCDPDASDGSETAVAVLYEACDASAGDTKSVIVARYAEVNADRIDFGAMDSGQTATAKTQLATATIFVREAI